MNGSWWALPRPTNVALHQVSTADELLEMVEIYVHERCSVGRREMAASRRGSVRWWWGRTVAVEMGALLELLRKA